MNRMRLITSRIINGVKTLSIVMAMAALAGGLAWMTLGLEIALAAVFFIVALYLLTPSMAPGMLLKYYKARRLDYSETPELYRLIRYLSSRAELESVPELYYIPTGVPAAFATGNIQNSGIAVSAGLLNRLSREETAAVLGHEISHIRNNDIRVMWFAMMVNRMTEFLSVMGQLLVLINLPLILLGGVAISWVWIAALVFAPTIAYILQMTLSRVREYSADLGSAELLGSPDPLISALTKIEYGTGRLFDRLFFRKNKGNGPAWLLTHPPTDERLRRLRALRPEIKRTSGSSQSTSAGPRYQNPGSQDIFRHAGRNSFI